jgi:hypothetical protein
MCAGVFILGIELSIPLMRFREHTRTMGDQRAVLTPVQDGDIWHVQIIWPNGKMDFVRGFSSEGDAVKWMDRHAWWLIEPITEKSTNESSSAA